MVHASTDALRLQDIELLLELTRKELRRRYRRTYLGYALSLLHPIALAAVFFLAFRIIMRFEMEHYPLFLLAGLFPWQWFSNSLVSGTGTYLQNPTLVRRLVFRRELLPLATVLNDCIHFVASLPVLIALAFYYGVTISAAWLVGIPLLVLAQVGFTYGLALVLSSANVFVRDLERISVILTTLLFYLTPVIYPAELIPDRFLWIFSINPMFYFITGYQEIILAGRIPLLHLGVAWAAAGLSLVIGTVVARSLRWRIPEAL